jgi:hypothetical protein
VVSGRHALMIPRRHAPELPSTFPLAATPCGADPGDGEREVDDT